MGSSSTIWLLQENCGCEVSAEAFEWAVRENGRKTECQRVSDDVLPNVSLHNTHLLSRPVFLSSSRVVVAMGEEGEQELESQAQ